MTDAPTTAAAEADAKASPLLDTTPSGGYIPKQAHLPRVFPRMDAFASTSPYLEGPIFRLGKRTSGTLIDVDTMIEMAHDEIVTFLNAQLAANLVNTTYTIECANPEKKAFFKAMYDNMHRQLMLALAPALYYGFQALVKEYAWGLPPTDDTAPMWSGTQDPIYLKGITQIHPAIARPAWTEGGSFDGIDVAELGASTSRIPTVYSLWVSLRKYMAFGDYLGWGRARAVYMPWHRKEYTKDQRQLWLQQGIAPSVKVWHPAGEYVDPDTGVATPYWEIAAAIGDGIKGGAVVTMPSSTYPIAEQGGFATKPSTVREWDAELVINTAQITGVDEIIKDEDKRICFAMYVAPQAVYEPSSLGLGGPNTVEVLGKVARETLMQDLAEIDEHINKHIFRFIDHSNWGPNDQPVRKVTTGLTETAEAAIDKVFENLLADANIDKTIFDLRELAERRGVPTVAAAVPVVVPATATPAQAVPVDPSGAQGDAPVQSTQPAAAAPQIGTQGVTGQPAVAASSETPPNALAFHLGLKHDQRNHGRRSRPPDLPAADKKARTASGTPPAKAASVGGNPADAVEQAAPASNAASFKTFANGDDADAWGKAAFGATAKSMTAKEKKAFFGGNPDSYQMMGAYYINAAMRQGTPSGKTKNPPGGRIDPKAIDKNVATIATMLNRSRTPEAVTAYRGVTYDDDGTMAKVMATWTPGSRHADKGFMSTTLDGNTAEKEFAANGTGTVIEARVPKGTRAMYMQASNESAAGLARERELLIQGGTPFTVKERHTDANGNVTKVVIEFDDIYGE